VVLVSIRSGAHFVFQAVQGVVGVGYRRRLRPQRFAQLASESIAVVGVGELTQRAVTALP
jgi:hypothetical protein